MEHLIGRRFRKNSKQGVSEWEDEVEEYRVIDKWDSNIKLTVPTIKVQAKNSKMWYTLSEIVFLNTKNISD